MSEDEFWNVVGRPAAERPQAGSDFWVEEVIAELARRSSEEIVAFDRHFNAALARSYCWELWGAAYLIGDGCSDDGFDYFRAGLIARGRTAYEAALRDADSLADYLHGGPGDDWTGGCERMLGAAHKAYQLRTGGPMPPPSTPAEPWSELGEDWDFDDPDEMERRYPRLWEKFGEE